MLHFSSLLSSFSRLVSMISLICIASFMVDAHGLKGKTHSKSVGKWISDTNGELITNPQSSGLSFSGGILYSVSDASADIEQRRQIRKLGIGDAFSSLSAIQATGLGEIKILGGKVSQSCFAKHLNTSPDYEALVALPKEEGKPQQWLLVTEDGTRGNKIEGECYDRYAYKSNFTHYPPLLVRLTQANDEIVITGIRALRFEPSDGMDKRNLLKFGRDEKSEENDGIEGLTLTRDNRLLFGVEQDAKRQARVFELDYVDEIFNTLDQFITLQDSKLGLYEVSGNLNPINGMDVYYPHDASEGFLIAGARNRDQLWIIDLAKHKPILVVDVEFHAPPNSCTSDETYVMKQVAMEGLAIKGDTLYLINDPWQQRYKENIMCESDSLGYEVFASLLFEMKLESKWFSRDD